MKAIQLRSFGAASDLKPQDVPESPLASGEVRVRVDAAGVNPSDIKNFEGRMHQTILPRILGRDFAGTVIEGPAPWLGRNVWGTGGGMGFTRDGTFAERAIIPVEALLEIPREWTPAQIASITLPAWTAWEALKRLTSQWRGKTLLVVGGTGSVGTCAALLAQRRGARVWRTTRHEESSGNNQSWINLTAGALNNQALKATEGRGMDFVLNTVGGETFQPSLASLAHHGRMVSIASSSPEVTFNLLDFYHRELTLIGLDTLAIDAEAAASSLREILPDLQSPEFHPLPTQTFSLQNAPQAFQYKGKAVLLPNA